jgi:hypothetical protein
VTFEGHTGDVGGAEILTDGRILSWANDSTLRLWDWSSGVALATFEHKWVLGATMLPDGRILSWCPNGTLRLWDVATGVPSVALDDDSLLVSHPEIHREYRRARSRHGEDLVLLGQVAAATALCGTIVHWPFALVKNAIWWCADGEWAPHHLLPDGTLVATRDKHLAILHLHHGNRRVSIEEAEALLAGGST